jgi:single-stranded-DNA-specific exonuclease
VGELRDALGLSVVTARLLVSRGIVDPDDAERFLHPSLERDWRDPSELPDMPKAAQVVADAVKAGRRIVVFGDYDADGVCGAAVLHRGLEAMGADVSSIVPHRFEEGYGLTAESLPRLLEASPELVVTVDCGVTAVDEVQELRRAGCDVVVTDHHEPGDARHADVPVVDPKLDASYPFHGLAGAGVGLKLVQAVGTVLEAADTWRELTDIAALGTVGDVVPLLDENRALVADGLARMRSQPRVAVAALAAVARFETDALTAQSIAFGLTPRLNAAGRMADPRVALELLLTDDPERAGDLARELDELNRLRQSTERDLFEQALVGAREQVDGGACAVVLAGSGWHEGVRGIVASRITRRLDVPSFVFTVEDGVASGSGRSVTGIDLHATLESVADLLDRFGGHPMAAGATLAIEHLDAFTRRFRDAVAGADRDTTGLVIDAEVALEDVGPQMAAEIALLEPFGEGNRKPLFGSRGAFLNGRRRVGRNDEHLIFDAFDGAASVPAVAFRCPEIASVASHEAAADLAFEIEEDEWRGRTRTRLLVRHINPHETDPDAPAAELVEDLFERVPAILAQGEYAGIGDADSFHTKLAGVTFEGRQDVVVTLEPGTPLRLERQPDNPHDANACALFGPDGRQVGFFNRRLAAAIAPLLDDGLEIDVTVTDVTGGEGDRSLGVNVLVERRGAESDGPDEASFATRRALSAAEPATRDARLAEHFLRGHSLRPAQAETLERLAAGRDCLTVMATGRGKSLIFHLHAAREALGRGVGSVFVYPLRALVSDQAFSLRESLGGLGIGCETITGETSPTARDEVFARFAEGATDVLLTTPEFLDRHAERFATGGRVGFLVVDEAHHVGLARAGHRPAYGRLGDAASRLGDPRVLAVTATAADDVAETICETLGITDVVTDPSVRENLRIQDQRGGRDKIAYITSLASRGEKVVVYVNSREKSIRIASQLRQKNPVLRHRCAFYNGGLGRAQRHAVEHSFRDGDLTVVMATSAFGEGIDIPDIRHVVHYHLPFGHVEFNQMSGRAGRDGEPAAVHLLFGPRDARLNELILESVAPERDDLAQLYLVLKDMQERAGDESFEVTNAELSSYVCERRAGSRMTDRGVSSALGVFRDLDLLGGEGAGSYRRLRLAPRPDGKVDLGSSVRYAEGLLELDAFREFRRWVLDAPPPELLAGFNRPILPTRFA